MEYADVCPFVVQPASSERSFHPSGRHLYSWPFLQYPAFAQGTGYWHTSGNQIIDSSGRTVRKPESTGTDLRLPTKLFTVCGRRTATLF